MKKFRLYKDPDSVFWVVDRWSDVSDRYRFDDLYYFKWTAKRAIKKALRPEPVKPEPKYEYYL